MLVMRAIPADKLLGSRLHIDFAHHSETKELLRIAVSSTALTPDNPDQGHALLTPGIYAHYKNGKLYKLHGLVLLPEETWAAWYTGLYGIGSQQVGPSWLRPLHIQINGKPAGWLDPPDAETPQRLTLVARLYEL